MRFVRFLFLFTLLNVGEVGVFVLSLRFCGEYVYVWVEINIKILVNKGSRSQNHDFLDYQPK